MTVTAYIALGSNLGDRKGYLDRAVDALRQQPGIEVAKVSSYHETDPVGGPANQGKYLNAAAELRTDLPARQLLETLLKVEQELGRVRGERNGPRTIDLDLLLHGDAEIQEEDLVVPHPRMLERLFVLEPLAEIAPDLKLPGFDATLHHLAGHARVHEEMDEIAEDVDRHNAQAQAITEMLQANPHPRKRRHLERMMKELKQNSATLNSRVQAVKAKVDHFHQDHSCHHPS